MDDTYPDTAALMRMALWYAARGHPIFPCHSPRDTGCSCRSATCKDIGKHPRTIHGLHDASTDASLVKRWWTQFPDANIGLRTGVTCWALDIDPRHGGDTTLAGWEQAHGRLPDTPVSLTGGGGVHYMFRPPAQGRIPTRTHVAEGVDTRGDGGYIVVPPSQHVSGRAYAWDSAYDIEDTLLAQAPAWLLTLCQESEYTPMPEAGTPLGDGQRNSTLSRMAFAMRKANMSLDAIYVAVANENTTRCIPPLDEDELRKIVEGKRHIGPDPVLRPSRPEPGSRNGQGKEQVPKAWPALTAATDILAARHPMPQWIVPGLIPEGLTIIGGLPKVAKSYMAYDIALACAGHGLGLGHFGVSRGRAAYLAIEDDASDSQQRLLELRPGIVSAPDLLFLHGEAVPSISEGLVEFLRLTVTELGLSLVVVDPLSYVYDPQNNKYQDSFREAKEMLLPLRQLARELHFALVFVDHRRKQGKDDHDVFQTLYGSVAKYAVADTLIMAVRRENEVILHCRGRKIKDQAISCTFTYADGKALWSVEGAQEEYASNTLRGKIRDAFAQAAQIHHRIALSVTDIMNYAKLEDTALMRGNVKQRLFGMYKAGELLRTDRGLYLMPGDDDSAGVEI